MLFQVIATFEDGEQDIFDIKLSYIKDEKEFVYIILNSIDIDNVKDLVKLSICQQIEKKSDIIEWLFKRNGKYYFNLDDDDTKKWYEIKNNYLKSIVTL